MKEKEQKNQCKVDEAELLEVVVADFSAKLAQEITADEEEAEAEHEEVGKVEQASGLLTVVEAEFSEGPADITTCEEAAEYEEGEFAERSGLQAFALSHPAEQVELLRSLRRTATFGRPVLHNLEVQVAAKHGVAWLQFDAILS